MLKIFKRIDGVSLIACVALFTSCGGKNEWTVKGSIEGAEGETMVLEASDNGRWYPLDSVKLDESGEFAMHQSPRGYPDIFRLRLGNKMLYFPIDSIETVTVNSRASAFDTEYTLDGSNSAQQFMEVDRKLRDVIAKGGITAVSADTLLKRELGNMVLGDGAGVLSYYLVNKRFDGTPIFNPQNKGDLRIIGAVANAYSQSRPNDPRTAYLKNLYLGNRLAESEMRSDTIHAKEVSVFDMELYDSHGKKRGLVETMGNGKVVLLNFTVMSADGAPEFNQKLYSIYKKYHDRGLEIYQVSVDDDEAAWRQAARNLPWVAVYNSPITGGRHLMNYNVIDIPVSFIIDRHGEIVERVEDASRLDALIAKYI